MVYDLIVLGGSPGGYLAAERGGHAGMKALCIEARAFGGVCLNEGCVPTKTLLYSAKLYDGAAHGEKYGMLDQRNSIVQENLTAIRTVKSFVRGEAESQKFGAANEEFCRASERAFHFAQLNLPSFQFVMYGSILAILWFGGALIRAGSFKVGQLTGFLSYVLQILNSLMMISSVFLLVSRFLTSGRRILAVMDETPEIQSGESGAKVEKGEVQLNMYISSIAPRPGNSFSRTSACTSGLGKRWESSGPPAPPNPPWRS